MLGLCFDLNSADSRLGERSLSNCFGSLGSRDYLKTLKRTCDLFLSIVEDAFDDKAVVFFEQMVSEDTFRLLVFRDSKDEL